MKYVVYPYSLRPETAVATEAAWCAQDQGKFFEYQRALFEKQGQIAYNEGPLNDLAKQLELDTATFGQCLATGKYRADVENARAAAANRGVSSTPTFFLNNRRAADYTRIEGNQPIEAFRSAIDQELAEAQ